MLPARIEFRISRHAATNGTTTRVSDPFWQIRGSFYTKFIVARIAAVRKILFWAIFGTADAPRWRSVCTAAAP